VATTGRRRALGQHFLKDARIAGVIAEVAVSEARKLGCQALLEIGPGKGAITHPILDRLGGADSKLPFRVCEKDPRLVAFWKERGSPEVIEGDFLERAQAEWLRERPLAVVSNLPYSVGTAILTRLAAHWDSIPVMVLMFQAEVAARVRAEVSTRAWGSLSVWIQNRWDVARLLHVKPGAFNPPPEVDSEVVVLRARVEPRIAVGPEHEALWEQLIRVSFAHRRKMLRSGLPPGPWRNALEVAGVDGTKRAEALSWEEWRSLFEAALKLRS
jgi:16S rRNA (adenine1518-N6/adenine1519-N6)-dimethyltransferase